jgi:hypothetical protein
VVPAVATVAVELDLANVVLPLKRDSGPIRVMPAGRFAALGRFTSSQNAPTVVLLPGVAVDCFDFLSTWHSGVITDVKKNWIQYKYSTGTISGPPYDGLFADPGVMTFDRAYWKLTGKGKLGLAGGPRVFIKPRLPGGGFGDELEGTVERVDGLQFSFKQTLEGRPKTSWYHVCHDCVRIDLIT